MDCIVSFLVSFWPWLGTGPHVVILVIIIVLAWQQGSMGGAGGRLILTSLLRAFLTAGGDTACLPGAA